MRPALRGFAGVGLGYCRRRMGTVAVSLALGVWSMRGAIGARVIRLLRYAFAALCIGIFVWILVRGWVIVTSPPPPTGSSRAQVYGTSSA